MLVPRMPSLVWPCCSSQRRQRRASRTAWRLAWSVRPIFGPQIWSARAERMVGGRGGGVPVETVFDGVFRIFPEKSAGGGFVGRAADVLKAPMEGLHTAVVVRGPAAMLVAADFALEEVHERSQPLTVY